MNYTFNDLQCRWGLGHANENLCEWKSLHTKKILGGGGTHYIYSGCGVSLKEHGWYIG